MSNRDPCKVQRENTNAGRVGQGWGSQREPNENQGHSRLGTVVTFNGMGSHLRHARENLQQD